MRGKKQKERYDEERVLRGVQGEGTYNVATSCPGLLSSATATTYDTIGTQPNNRNAQSVTIPMVVTIRTRSEKNREREEGEGRGKKKTRRN